MPNKIIRLLFFLIVFATAEAGAGTLRFADVYNLPFYKNNLALGGLMTVGSILTAGLAVPTIAIGVGTFSSAMARGGGAAYLRAVGGNERIGSLVLNGLSIGAELNAGKAFSTGTLLALKSVQAGGLGAMMLNNIAAVKIQILPSDVIGSETIQAIMKQLQEALEGVSAKRISMERFDGIVRTQTEQLVDFLARNENREDEVAGAVILYSLGKYPEFIQIIQAMEVQDEQESYLYYLKAVAFFLQHDYESAEIAILRSIQSEPETLEPKMLYLMILNDFGKHEKFLNHEWLEVLLSRFDKNHYDTPNSLTSFYNLAGDLAFAHDDYATALAHHSRAFDEIGFLSDRDDKALLCLKISMDYERLRAPDDEMDYARRALLYVEDEHLKAQIDQILAQD